jgi:hypothetical protein
MTVSVAPVAVVVHEVTVMVDIDAVIRVRARKAVRLASLLLPSGAALAVVLGVVVLPRHLR